MKLENFDFKPSKYYMIKLVNVYNKESDNMTTQDMIVTYRPLQFRNVFGGIYKFMTQDGYIKSFDKYYNQELIIEEATLNDCDDDYEEYIKC